MELTPLGQALANGDPAARFLATACIFFLLAFCFAVGDFLTNAAEPRDPFRLNARVKIFAGIGLICIFLAIWI